MKLHGFKVAVVAALLSVMAPSAASAHARRRPRHKRVDALTESTSVSRDTSFSPFGLKRIFPVTSVLVSGFTGTDAANFSTKTGWGLGVLGDIGPGPWSLETGFLFRDLGASIQDGRSGAAESISLRCVSLPAWAKYNFYSWAQNVLFAKAGLIFSAVAAKDQSGLPSDVPALSNREGVPFLESLQPVTLEASAGAGGMFRLSRALELILEADYSEGTTSLVANEQVFDTAVSINAGLALAL